MPTGPGPSARNIPIARTPCAPKFFGFDTKTEQVQQRAVATVNYALGPGINLDGEVGYTWRDRDPGTLDGTDEETDDDYDGLELGIGTALSF